MRKMTKEQKQLKKEIDDCKSYINALKNGFNEASDGELISYYIYEEKAARQKYRYLLSLYSRLT